MRRPAGTYTTPFSRLQKEVEEAREEANNNNKFLHSLTHRTGASVAVGGRPHSRRNFLEPQKQIKQHVACVAAGGRHPHTPALGSRGALGRGSYLTGGQRKWNSIRSATGRGGQKAGVNRQAGLLCSPCSAPSIHLTPTDARATPRISAASLTPIVAGIGAISGCPQ